jgi:DNA-binding transcriptional regulator YhcF (GntR family)
VHTDFTLNSAQKLNLLSISYQADLPGRAARLLHRFIDRPDSLLWSSLRLANSLHCSVSTIERALRELKELGIISVVRRRRSSLVKVLNPDRIKALAYVGREAAKAAYEAAKLLVWKAKSLSRQIQRLHVHFSKTVADEEAPWRVQGPAKDYHRRFMGLPTGEKRRKPKV